MTASRDCEPYRFSGSGIVCAEGAFDPDQARALHQAFGIACDLLNVQSRDTAARHRLAKIMLMLVRTKNASAHEIIDDALVWFAHESHLRLI